MTHELPARDPFEDTHREARAELFAAVARAEDAAFALGVEAAAVYLDVCGRERGGYFGQAAATLAEMLRVAASRHAKALEDEGRKVKR